MVPIFALWLPILLSAVFVFVLSSLIHMVLGYHAGDYRKVPNEDGLMDALKKLNIPPGDYMFPRPANMKDMGTPEFKEKVLKNPNGLLRIWEGTTSMAAPMTMWFVYSLVVGVFAAYVTGRALPEGAHYLAVFRFAGVTAFVAYTLAGWQESIWYKRPWSVTLKNTFDGLLYGLVSAGTFGWLWPR
jgi:hypothetical protein